MNQNYQNIHNEYGTWLDTLGFSDRMVYNFKHMTIEFFLWLEKQNVYHIKLLTNKHIKNYFEYLQLRPNKKLKGGLSISHLNSNFIAIDKLMECLHQIGMENAPNPTNFRLDKDIQQSIYNIQPFTQEEIKELQAEIPNTYQHLNFLHRETKQEQLKLIFALCYACGLRRAESCNLTINDIDFDKRIVFVKQGKNYKDRIIPMNDSIYKALQHYIYNFRNLQKTNHKRLFIHGYLALSRSLKHLQQTCNNETIKNKRFTLHILRHSIATHLLQNGMSIESIARFLGHNTLDSTQIYTHIVNR